MTIQVKDATGSTQTVKTIDDLAADGGQATIGANADAAVAAGATGSLSAKLRAISRDLVANIVLAAGANILGKVGIDQTTPGTTNKVAVAVAEIWKAGTLAGLAWATSGFSTEVNSVVNGNAILAAAAVDNSTALDEFFDLSVSLGSITPGAGAPYVGFYLVPLNQDGTSYGDGRFGSSAAGPPASQYFVGSVPCIASTAGVITGMIRGILLPPGSFKLILYNQAGATLAASANTIKIRSYNRSVS